MKLDPNTNVGGGFGWNIDPPLPPEGQYVGVCLDVKDEFGVERTAFQSQEKEKRDITRFLFGIVHPQTRQPFLVQTFEFNISGGANSNLVKFLRAWTNRDPYGFDYLELKGQGVLLNVAHKQSSKTPGVVYATITGVTPVYPTLQGEIPQPSLFAPLVAKANSPRSMAAPGTRGQAVPPASLGRKFWTQGHGGAVVLVSETAIVEKGDPHRMVMAENQVGGWVPANTVITFPSPVAPPPPLGAPMPPTAAPLPPPPTGPAPAGWGVPPAAPAPPAAALPTAQDDEIPF